MESCSVSRKYAFDGRIHGYSYIVSRQRSRPSTCFHELSTNDKSQAWLHDVMAQCSSKAFLRSGMNSFGSDSKENRLRSLPYAWRKPRTDWPIFVAIEISRASLSTVSCVEPVDRDFQKCSLAISIYLSCCCAVIERRRPCRQPSLQARAFSGRRVRLIRARS